MDVFLVRSEGVTAELFNEVLALLKSPSKLISFKGDETRLPIQLPNRRFLKWDELFDACAKERRAISDLKQDSFLILLTDKPNQGNYFAYLNPHHLYDGFVHTGDWEEFLDAPAAFPIAYHVLAIVLQKYMVVNGNGHELINVVHDRPIGCVNDFCEHKREVILKLRTADICRNCMNLLIKNLAIPKINHVLQLFESLRVKMLTAQKMGVQLSKVFIDDNDGYRIFLTDYDNLEIKLYPLERVLYILFKNNPDGIVLSYLHDYYNEMLGIYGDVGVGVGLVNAEAEDRINELCDPVESKPASIIISKIKKAFINALGSDELARHYYIAKRRGDIHHIPYFRNQLQNP